MEISHGRRALASMAPATLRQCPSGISKPAVPARAAKHSTRGVPKIPRPSVIIQNGALHLENISRWNIF